MINYFDDKLVRRMQDELTEMLNQAASAGNMTIWHQAEDTYTLDVVAPGFAKSDFDISVAQNCLNIKAKSSIKRTSSSIVKRDINFAITLPLSLDVSTLTTQYEAGVLTFTAKQRNSKDSIKIKVV